MITSKNAFLIIAHNEFGILQRLVKSLDSSNNDLFIHFDAKVKRIPHILVEHAKLIILKKRVDVRWGHYSQIECEFELLKAANEKGPYSYYHIISGVHLPIKPLKDINQFYDLHVGKEIMHIISTCKGKDNFKLGRYNWGIKNFKCSSPIKQRLVQLRWTAFLKIQKIFGIYRNPEEEYIKADQWCSITQKAVSYLLNREKEIIEKYKFAFCCDEYFIATELTNGGFDIYNSEKLLFLIWKKESPKVLTEEDYEKIMLSDCLFARKFSEKQLDIVDRICSINKSENATEK